MIDPPGFSSRENGDSLTCPNGNSLKCPHVLECIKNKIGAEHCRQSCTKDGCRVDLNDTPSPHLIVDPESNDLTNHSPDNNKKCDLIFFFQDSKGNLVVVPLELKTGEVKATLVKKQLQAGVEFAESMIPEPKPCCPVFHPILIHAGNLHRFQRDELNQAKIPFRGADLTIQTAKCDQPGNLAKVLSNKRGQAQGKKKR